MWSLTEHLWTVGKKCKFSHDLSVERKAEKKNLYEDTRDGEGEKDPKEENMDDWDEEKLRKVVLSKHGNPKTTTDKVCKYFIEAVENGKYGWFWQCPNGGDKCMYRHSLPPGSVSFLCPIAPDFPRGLLPSCRSADVLISFVLKTKEQRAAEKALMDKSPLKTLTLEDFLEASRAKLTGSLTPVTPESFAKWKKDRLDKKAAEEEARKAKEATGRAMFEKGDWRFEEDVEDDDDEDAADTWNLDALRRETEEAGERKEQERIQGEAGGGGGGVGDGGDGGGEMNGVNGAVDEPS